jgi:hypothetical protein
MIDRGLTLPQIAALTKDEVGAILFVDLDTPSGRVLCHTGLGDRPFMGQTYLGIGELGGVGDFTENTGSSPSNMPLTLKLLDPSLVAVAMNETLEGREIVMHLGLLDDNKQIAHEIPYIFDGYVAKKGVKRGDISKSIPYVIRLTCSDWMERWNQPPSNARTTNAAQQNLYPGDRIFDLTEIIAGSSLASLPVKNTRTNTRPGKGGYLP